MIPSHEIAASAWILGGMHHTPVIGCQDPVELTLPDGYMLDLIPWINEQNEDAMGAFTRTAMPLLVHPHPSHSDISPRPSHQSNPGEYSS